MTKYSTKKNTNKEIAVTVKDLHITYRGLKKTSIRASWKHLGDKVELFHALKGVSFEIEDNFIKHGKVEKVEEHHMHSEHFYIKQEDADKINSAKKNKKRIIAIGTTSCRVLETIADETTGMVRAVEDNTQIFIYPGYKFKCIDGLITNFHLPESTLLMLVSALAGKDFIMKAYNEAVKEKYRFFSFGDAMFIN